MSDTPSISVIICTQDRAESLRITLECLARAMRPDIRAEVIVVDNAGQDNTKEVVESFASRLHVVYLYEAKTGNYGKSHALNRALDHGCSGEIIAVLDDDMSPDDGWFQAVASISSRWQDRDLFTGGSYVIWPPGSLPGWALKTDIQGWIFSVQPLRAGDIPLDPGRWFLGGHFWFRARVLTDGRRFKDIWLTEPDFQLDLIEAGYRGIASSEAAAGHRVQPALLDEEGVLARAKRTGGHFAWLRVNPYRRHVKQARLLRAYPVAGRIFCLINYLRWRILLCAAHFIPSADRRFARRLVAIERSANYRELLRAACGLEQYSISARWPVLRLWRKA